MIKRSSHVARRAVLNALIMLAERGWDPTINHVMLLSRCPRRTCYRALEDLERDGYIRRHRIEVLREEYER